MCSFYSITTNQAAIIALFRAINHNVGKQLPMPRVFWVRAMGRGEGARVRSSHKPALNLSRLF